MSEIERATRRALRVRWAERRRRRIISRLQNIVCAVGILAGLAGRIWLDWPELVAAAKEPESVHVVVEEVAEAHAEQEVSVVYYAAPAVEEPAVAVAEIAMTTTVSEMETVEDSPLDSLGEFKITHYCACSECCGKAEDDPWYGITATGTRATEGRTIAVDPKVIPYGTEVTICYQDGTEHTYIAEDCGGAIKGNRIDVYMAGHDAANIAGVKHGEVFINA